MTVGQLVTKQTWMLDQVEVCGTVSADSTPEGADVGTRDDFDVVPDDNYRHLVNLIPGGGGKLHCETYPLPAEHVNRNENWDLPQKDPSESFTVRDPATGAVRALRVGDHIRVVGRLTIDHHPESCVTRNRGLLRVGCVWPELHPFRWDSLELVSPAPEQVTISLAAPVHEECYLGGGKWLANEVAGVASHIFIADDGSNYHETVTASAHVPAPALPPGWTFDEALVGYSETVLENGTGRSVDQLRTITTGVDGLKIDASVTAPKTFDAGGPIADVNDPANGRSTFRATYSVTWRPRLTCPPLQVTAPGPGSPTDFNAVISNRGPDPVSINAAGISEATYSVTSVFPLVVPARGQVTLNGRFSPPAAGLYPAVLRIDSNDPANQPLLVEIRGTTGNRSGRLRVRVDPPHIRMNKPVLLTIITEDTGDGGRVDGTASVTDYNGRNQPSPFQTPTNQPFTHTFHAQLVFDPEIKKWVLGEEPSGTVTVPLYDQDKDAPIPFDF